MKFAGLWQVARSRSPVFMLAPRPVPHPSRGFLRLGWESKITRLQICALAGN